jgi:hypothetical protein
VEGVVTVAVAVAALIRVRRFIRIISFINNLHRKTENPLKISNVWQLIGSQRTLLLARQQRFKKLKL